MKKLALLCSFGLLGSFAFAGNSVFNTISKNVFEVISESSEQALKVGCCTANVYYNGVLVQSYTVCGTSNNCGLAEAFAKAYVAMHD
ncbi:MAG TPA: hypothetical protein VL022_05315 [Moheibacter sp.]|nr:hypothetical protein [Moheibacter sp.]